MDWDTTSLLMVALLPLGGVRVCTLPRPRLAPEIIDVDSPREGRHPRIRRLRRDGCGGRGLCKYDHDEDGHGRTHRARWRRPPARGGALWAHQVTETRGRTLRAAVRSRLVPLRRRARARPRREQGAVGRPAGPER